MTAPTMTAPTMTAPTMTAPTTVAPAQLTPEQDAALALLADPGDQRPTPGYVMPQTDAKRIHRQLTRTLTAAGRPNLMESQPIRELGSIATDTGAFMLHPADEHAISRVAHAFGAGDIGMVLVTARLLHDSKAKYRARQAVASA